MVYNKMKDIEECYTSDTNKVSMSMLTGRYTREHYAVPFLACL